MTARFDYAGRTVFVAGGTSGINLGIAQAFAAAGSISLAAKSIEATGWIKAPATRPADRSDPSAAWSGDSLPAGQRGDA